MGIGVIIGLIFFVALIIQYNSNPTERNRYYELERKRRFGGKRLSPQDQKEWERLAKKYRW